MKKQTFTKSLCWIFVVLLFVMTFYVFGGLIRLYCFCKLDVKKYEITQIELQPMNYSLTNDDYATLLRKIYATPHIYFDTENMQEHQLGHSRPLIRTVTIRKNLSEQEYVVTYAHELTHVKFMYGNETMTHYKTFVVLYESGHPELRHMALSEARDILLGAYSGTSYDCGYYILEYLKEKGEIE